MKKILLLVAAFATVFVNAANIDWKLQTGLDYVGFNVYAISGTTSSAVIATFLSTTEADWTAAVEGLTAYAVTGSNARAGATGTSTGVVAGDNLVFVMFNGAVTEGTQYWVMNDFTVPSGDLYEPPATGPTSTVKMTDLGIAATGTFTATAVPEPASAMLALAGVAMLIRRRK